MPTCQNCDQKWTWKQTVKKSFTLDTAMPCPYCGQKQYVTSKSRKRGALLTMIIPFLVFIPYFFDITLLIAISIYVVVGIGVMLIHPFFIELSNREEAFW